MILAQVIVRPRTSIFDPQGEAVKQALRSMGLTTVTQANVGKCIELHLDTADVAEAQEALEGVCRDLLSNPVIEDFDLVLMDMDAPVRKARAKSPKKPVKSAAKTAPASVRAKARKTAAAITAKPEVDVAEIAESLRKQEKAVKKLAKEAKKKGSKKNGKKKKKS